MKQYVEDLTAISRQYRDNGHPQFWGRITGTEADADNAKWLETDDVVPPTGLAASTRAYAKIITDVNDSNLAALVRPRTTEARR